MANTQLFFAMWFSGLLLFTPISNSVVLSKNLEIMKVSNAAPPPYFEYTIYQGQVIEDPILPPVLPNGQGDYAAIFNQHNICSLVNEGKISEVWIWAGNGDGVTKGNLWEWNTSGPGWSSSPFWQIAIPNCGKVVTVMTFNYLRDVDVALESYNHRLEGFFMNYFPCDFSTATWPWRGNDYWSTQCEGHLSNQYGFVARPFTENGRVGNCGDAHHPPNILNDQDYIYSDLSYANTNCSDWSMDGASQTVSVNCEAWGCSHAGYHVWWMQNLPGYKNTNRDRSGKPMPNWWSYILGTPPIPYKVFLPNTMQNSGSIVFAEINPTPSSISSNLKTPSNSVDIERQPSTHFFQQYATRNEQNLSAHTSDNDSSLSSFTSSLTSQPAINQRNVMVIYFPGYGGTPRSDVNELTNELIGYLKTATIYHGYKYESQLHATFSGQDGMSYAGVGCATGINPDNAHIHLSGLKQDSIPVNFHLEDPVGAGVWARPCNPLSNWLLYIANNNNGQADLYFKPFRNAPDGTLYTIRITYSDGSIQTTAVLGTSIGP